MGERARVFFACWPSPGLAHAIHQHALQLQRSCQGRVMKQDTLHLTLAFLGDIERARLPAIEQAATGLDAAPFRLRLERQGSWHGHRILWLAPGSMPDSLRHLQRGLSAILRQAGFRLEAGNYSPHLTVLRNARSEPPDEAMPEALEWDVSSFRLVESQRLQSGAHYRTLGEWPLARK